MTRNTRNDRIRKIRIRRHEFNRLRKQMDKLETINDSQVATLRELAATQDDGKLTSVSSVPGWEDLRDMGVVRDIDGELMVTSVGYEVLETEA